MKKGLLFLGLMALSATLIGCGEITDPPVLVSSEFELIARDLMESESSREEELLKTVKHAKTGCYYLIYRGVQKGGITQMFVEKNGVSVPYCE